MSDIVTRQRIKGRAALDYALSNLWFHGKMPLYLAALCQNEHASKVIFTACRISSSVLRKAGVDEEEYEKWREVIMPKLVLVWLAGATYQADDEPPLDIEDLSKASSASKLILQENLDSIKVPAWDIDHDIATWYINTSSAILQSFEHTLPLQHGEKSKNHELPITAKKGIDLMRMAAEIELQNTLETRSQASNKKERKGSLPRPTVDDLEKSEMSFEDILEYCEKENNVNGDASREELKKQLRNATSKFKKENIANNGLFIGPERLGKTVTSSLHRIAIVNFCTSSKKYEYGVLRDMPPF